MNEKPNISRLEALAEKWLLGTITPEEAQEYADWYNEQQDNPIDIPADFAISEKQHRDRILGKIHLSGSEVPEIISKKSRRLYYGAAAAAIILIFLGITFYNAVFKGTDSNAVKTANANPTDSIIVPGGNKAILRLADGTLINLQQSKDGLLASQGNSSVVKTEQGQLVYHAQNGKTTFPSQNLISIPRGGKFAITLADGTKVWLNAASSLSYPCVFEGNQREVTLTGEAYFEVAHDPAHPFIVRCKGQAVKVLGTHFNINAYEDEATVRTTLLEGKVNVSTSARHESKFLLPGQQSVLSGSNLSIKKVNTAFATAWQKGNFMFDREDIQSIMREIARWYDVQITFDGDIPQDEFAGTVSRFKNVTDVLQILQLTGKVHFRIKGRSIIVSKHA
ncbi:MAG TPA: FecR domain-containing protein [Arachidicoccus sp.]|nr:FecR domain-containing protein [Arachidicoccus sp.]